MKTNLMTLFIVSAILMLNMGFVFITNSPKPFQKDAVNNEVKIVLSKITKKYNEQFNAEKMSVVVLTQTTIGRNVGDTLKTVFWKLKDHLKVESRFFAIYQDWGYMLQLLKEPKVMTLKNLDREKARSQLKLDMGNQIDSLLKTVEEIRDDKKGTIMLNFPKIGGVYKSALRRIIMKYNSDYELVKTEYFYQNGRSTKEVVTLFTNYTTHFNNNVVSKSVLNRLFDKNGKLTSEFKGYRLKDLRS